MNFENIKRVRLNDYSEYESGKANNGGQYGFWTDYNRVESGWEVSHGTTADFPYCACCGSFGEHEDYENGGFECRGGESFDIISTEELQVIIKSFEKEHSEDADYSIEYEEDRKHNRLENKNVKTIKNRTSRT